MSIPASNAPNSGSGTISARPSGINCRTITTQTLQHRSDSLGHPALEAHPQSDRRHWGCRKIALPTLSRSPRVSSNRAGSNGHHTVSAIMAGRGDAEQDPRAVLKDPGTRECGSEAVLEGGELVVQHGGQRLADLVEPRLDVGDLGAPLGAVHRKRCGDI